MEFWIRILFHKSTYKLLIFYLY